MLLLPIVLTNVLLSHSCPFQIVNVVDQITVRWNGISMAEVTITDPYLEKVCGLCGNANLQKGDDWTIGDSKLCMEQYPNEVPGQIVCISTTIIQKVYMFV